MKKGMFNRERTSQSVGNNSFGNTQAQGDITIYKGMSYEDVKALFYDLFEQNLYRLSNEAKEIADQRCKEFIDKFLNQLISKNQNGLTQASNPDFQYDLVTAQIDYARYGDPELADMLVNLLIERTKETQKSQLQIVLNESIATASKLTREEYDILTLWFVSEYIAENQEFHNISDLKNFIETYILSFLDSFNKEKFWYPHLVYAGCGFIQAFKVMDIYSIIHNKSAGITPKEFYNIYRYLVSEYPSIEQFFHVGEVLNNGQNYKPESCMSLTSVGIAIGYANLCRITGEEFNLSKWL
ncbi:LPO_1073/Vpar_1526 family protein [Methanosarcina barkeri]|nr:LPO_1073/Vpar_1526 family protein [Methanosarcina barkeri]